MGDLAWSGPQNGYDNFLAFNQNPGQYPDTVLVGNSYQISWGIASDKTGYQLTGARIDYGFLPSYGNTASVGGSTTSYTISGDTIDRSGTLYVKLTVEGTDASGNSVADVRTTSIIVKRSISFSSVSGPSNGSAYGIGEDVVFGWQLNYDGNPSDINCVKIEYSTDGRLTWTLAKQINANDLANGNSLLSCQNYPLQFRNTTGTYYWRMQAQASDSDPSELTSSGNYFYIRQRPVATASSPNGASYTVDSKDILFQWTVSWNTESSDSEKGSALEYRYANTSGGLSDAAWQSLGSTSGTTNRYVQTNGFSNVGYYEWRVRASTSVNANTDATELVGPYSSKYFSVGASTSSGESSPVSYNDVSVELLAPANTSFDRTQEIEFAIRVKPDTGTICNGVWAKYSIDNGISYNDLGKETNLHIRSDANDSQNTVFFKFTFNNFPDTKTVRWKACAKHSQQIDWGDWTNDASFTLADPSDVKVTIIAPQTSKTSTSAIEFKYSLKNNASGHVIGGVRAQYSQNSGESWTDLFTNTTNLQENTELSYTAPAGTFHSGTVDWRIQAKLADQSSWPEAWTSGSFQVTTEVESGLSVLLPSDVTASINRTLDTTFKVELTQVTENVNASDAARIKEAVFHWQANGETEWTDVKMVVSNPSSGNPTATVLIPAATFPKGSLTWYISVETNYSDNSPSTDPYNVLVLASQIDAYPLSPISEVISIETENTFTWNVFSTPGISCSKVELEYSSDASNWKKIGTINSIFDSCIIGAYYFIAGRMYWRIRAYDNTDKPGAWSTPVSFLAIGATQVRNLMTNGKPFTTVGWSATGQVAYEIRVDEDIVYGPYFGTEKIFTLPEYLEDGEHTISVRAQNATEVWSNWESVRFTVDNESDDWYETNLQVYADVDAVLRWTENYGLADEDTDEGSDSEDLGNGDTLNDSGNDDSEDLGNGETPNDSGDTNSGDDPEWIDLDDPMYHVDDNHINPTDDTDVSDVSNIQLVEAFLIYRDDRRIAEVAVTEHAYTDRLVLGQHSYHVVHRLANGDYLLFGPSSVYLSSDITRIALYDGGPWMELLLTEEQYPTNTFNFEKTVSYQHVMGSKYPVVEISEFEDETGSYSVVWPYTQRDQARRFEEFRGKVVIMKSRGEKVLVGVLKAYDLPINSKTVGFSFSIQRSAIGQEFGNDDSRAYNLLPLTVSAPGTYFPSDIGADGFSVVNVTSSGTNLDTVSFGEMTAQELAALSNPGSTDPQWYEEIAKAINEVLNGSSESSDP